MSDDAHLVETKVASEVAFKGKLLEVRSQLKDLQSRTEGNDRLEEMLNEIIDNEGLRSKMKDATGAGTAGSEEGGQSNG